MTAHVPLPPKQQLALSFEVSAREFVGVFDKGGRPYFLHLIAVMNNLHSKDDELNTIAILHDIIEDTKITAKQLLEMGFSERVVNAVVLLTKVKGPDFSLQQYVLKITSSYDAMRVKMADLEHNSMINRQKGISKKDMVRIQEYNYIYNFLAEALQRYEAMTAAFDSIHNG